MNIKHGRALATATSVLAIAWASAATAGSFAIKERSTRAQGVSFAGVTAGSGGLESMSFNPAALGVVEDVLVSGGLSFIQPIADGTVVSGGATGQTVEAGRFAGLGNNYVGYRMEPDILIGLGVYTPFGLTTQYEATDVAAGDAITSKLQTIVIAPTVAYQPVPEVTLGASLNIMYTNARLTSLAQRLDGKTIEFGFALGATWQPTDQTSIGLAYQHGYDLAIEGTLNEAVPATASAELPGVISLGVIQGLTDDLRIMGEVQWQNWSVFDSIDVSAPAIALNAADPQNYDDAFFIAAGAEYDISDDFTVRLGAAWDQTPTNSDTVPGTPAALGITNRTARVPDEDRVWLSIGASYDMNDHMSLNVGYSYVHSLEDAVVGLRSAPGTTIEYSGGAHILSFGGSMKF